MSQLTRREAVSSVGCALILPGASSAVEPTGSSNYDLHGTELDSALVRMDRTLFPDKKAMLAGAVLGGLVLFAVTRNPMGLLIGAAGGAVIGGVAAAAVHYIESRSNALGHSLPALQNATLGDHRADVYHTAPYSKILDESIAETAAPLNPYMDVLNRYSANKSPGAIPDDARKALIGIYDEVTKIGNKLDYLATFAVKHRDAGTVYEDIAPRLGLNNDPRFIEHAQTWQERSDSKRNSILQSQEARQNIIGIINSTLPRKDI